MSMDLVFFFSALALPSYMLVCLADVVLATSLEKKLHYYPLIDFDCFCGKHWSNLSSPILFPNRLYDLYKIHRHISRCLPWIMVAEFNGLTPYWGSSLAEDLSKPSVLSSFITKEWLLKKARFRSQRVRAGRDPFDDSDGRK